jgi:hypothetical protein
LRFEGATRAQIFEHGIECSGGCRVNSLGVSVSVAPHGLDTSVRGRLHNCARDKWAPRGSMLRYSLF